MLHRYLIILLCVVSCSVFSTAYAERQIVKVGYVNVEPYLYKQANHEGFKTLTGLDANLLNLIFSQMNLHTNYQEVSLAQGLRMLQTGELDALAGTTYSFERARYGYFSDSYRTETDAMYVRSSDLKYYHFPSLRRLLASPYMQHLRFGVLNGQAFSDRRLNLYFKNPRFPDNLIYANNTADNVNKLLEGKIDAFFDDEMGTENFIWRNKLQADIVRLPLAIDSKNVHLLFSKKNFSLQQVIQFNTQLELMHTNGTYQNIIRKHLVPRMIAIMTETRWYHIAEMLGVISFAIAGMLLAKRAQFDLISTLIIASLPASAGGIMRDVILNRQPIGLLRTPAYILTVITTVLTGYALIQIFLAIEHRPLFQRLQHHLFRGSLPTIQTGIRYFDVFAQSAFVVTGVMVCVETHATPLWLWGPIFAILSSCGGGILRDFILGIGFNRSYLYETVLVWGLLLSTFIIWRTEQLNLQEVLTAVIITMVGLIASRMLTLRFGWRSLGFWTPVTNHRQSQP